MDTIYLYAAAIGGTILVLQTILLFAVGDTTASGVDADAPDIPHDPSVGHDADVQNAFLKVLSLKTVVAFLTFFGLAGLAARHAGFGSTASLVVSGVAGLTAVYIVAHLMSGLSKLQSRGNVDLANAVGGRGEVYIRVPANHAGVGRVMITVQGRRIECRAVTAGPEILTGHEIRVTRLSGPGTLEVEPVAT